MGATKTYATDARDTWISRPPPRTTTVDANGQSSAPKELDGATRKDFFLVQREGSRDVTRSIVHYDYDYDYDYDLDVIISVGCRVHSPLGVHIRRWTTTVLG